MGERLSAPQSYFLASCRIAAVLHFASFLNALGFDFDISDPPWFLQKQLGRSVPVCGEGANRKRGRRQARKRKGVKRSIDWFLFSQLYNWPVQKERGRECSICFQFCSQYERSDKLLWVSQKLKTGFFSQSKNRVFFIAKTTQNELTAKPPSLSSHGKHNALMPVCECVRLRQKKKKNLCCVLEVVRQGDNILTLSAKTKTHTKGNRREKRERHSHLLIYQLG